MLNFFKNISIGLVALFSTVALANSDRYIGSNYSILDYENTYDISFTAVGLVAGTKTSIHENLSAELRLAGGMFGSQVISENDDINVDLKYYYGAYLKYDISAKDDFSPYAVIGYTRSKVVSSDDQTDNDAVRVSGISYGVGVDYALNDSSLINFEYINYIDSGDVSIDSISLGIKELF